ncbi:ROK family protein [Candidatus Woesearchaeota archaeon]|nr:ROK family protein [Candidatus Woesearchaeota archaeon]
MIIGVDLGGTFIKAGLVDNGRILRKIAKPTEAEKGKQRVIRNVLDCIAELQSDKVESVGIGSPGQIDHTKGVVLNSSNLQISNVNFPGIILQELNLPAKIDNDANCFALGEFLHGAGEGARNMVGITMGTGIGSGVIIDCRLYTGRNAAAELGHTVIKHNGEMCACGRKGHLEAYTGTRGIQKLFGKKLSPEDIFKLAAKRNKNALKTWDSVGNYLGVGIANAIHTYDPDVVVIGGSVAKAWRFFSKSMMKTVNELSLLPKTKIVKASLADAGVIGAASL